MPLALAAATPCPAAAPAAGSARAVDFELRPARVHAAGRGPVTSRPLRPGRAFNVVGLRWASGPAPAVRLRVRRDGRGWSRWVRVGADGDHGPDAGSGERTRRASDPLWTRRADWVQYRLSRPVGGLVLHFVRTRPAAAAAAHARARLSAAQAEAQPEIAPRAEWDPGNDCPPRTTPAHGQVDVAFVHHTAGASYYSPEDVPSIILGICRYHRNSNGWNDLGYNFVVDRFGRLWEGRAGGIDQPVIGAQAQGFNSQSTGIANLGTFSDAPQTDAALSAMARLIRWKLPLHGQPTAGRTTLVSGGGETNRWPSGRPVEFERVSGHRDADQTECPGAALYAQLPDLRNRVGSVAPAPAGARPTLAIDPPTPRVQRGRLLAVSGRIAPAKPYVTLILDRKVRGRWTGYRRIALPVQDGAFAKKVRLRKFGLYRVYARFGGDGGNAPTRSHKYGVRVPRAG